MDANQSTIMSVSQNIRTLRLKAGWSLRESANRLGISTSALSKIETGFTDVSLSRLEQIANIYGVTLVQLWTLDFENIEQQLSKLNNAKKKVFDLESDIADFQRKIISLYEKLRSQATESRMAHT